MEYISTQKYLRTTPRKLREVTYVIKNMSPVQAIEVLPHMKKRAAVTVLKAVMTCVANAVVKGANPEELMWKEIQVGEGPRLKRFRAGSRGVAKPYVKRLSHLRIVLMTKDMPKVEEPKAAKEEKKPSNVKAVSKTAKKGDK